ncbi:MAG: Ribonuclease VapC9 [Anaerolineales bacterium]|nr:Ribonuclease VapC9 [Anaerolineales bacterium]
MNNQVNNQRVCVDASLAAKWVLPEEYQTHALQLLADWTEAETEVVAPPHLPIEVTNAIRKRVWRTELTQEEAKQTLSTFERFRVTLLARAELYQDALDIAHQFNRPTVYDAHYVALAQLLGCELWTADSRLYNAVKEDLEWVRFIGEYETTEEHQ